jgi:hypothetical protein
MRKRNEKKRADRSKWLQEALSAAEKSIADRLNIDSSAIPNCVDDTEVFVIGSCGNIESQHVNNLKQEYSPEFDWSEFVDTCLDPSSGELQPLRAKRKRQQLSSIIHHIEAQIKLSSKTNPRIVDFGAGSGHLGLLVATRNPHCFVTLVERKAYSNRVAHERITSCGLTNVSIYHDDATTLVDSTGPFDIGVSMHSCGQLTDVALELCVQIRAGFVITPCCYGQISKPPPSFIPDSMLAAADDAFEENMDQTTPTVEPLTNFRSLEGTNSDMFCAITSGADFTACFEDISDEALLSGASVAKTSYLLAKRCMRAVDYDRAIGVLALAGCRYEFYFSTLRPLTCSPKNDLIVGRCLAHTELPSLAAISDTSVSANCDTNNGIFLLSDSAQFQALVRNRTAFIPGPCVLDLCVSNVYRYTGYSSFDTTMREMHSTLPTELCREIERCALKLTVHDAFAVRNELVNFKKACLHLYHRVQNTDCSLRQYSTLFFCDIVHTPVDDPAHQRYSELCGATMQCKGYMRVVADMRQFCKLIASIPRHKDADSVGYAAELRDMPRSLGCFQLLRKAEEWLVGKGVLTIGAAAQAEETLASDGEEEFARLVSAIVEGVSTTIAGREPPVHYKEYIERCLVARGTFKAIRIRACLQQFLVASRSVLMRAETASNLFRPTAHCRYQSTARGEEEYVKDRIHCDMHGNVLEGMLPPLRACCDALSAILHATTNDTVLFSASDVAIASASTGARSAGDHRDFSSLLHPPSRVLQVLAGAHSAYQQLLQSTSWRWPPSAEREGGGGRYMKVNADTDCFRCGNVFAKIWVKRSLVSGHLNVCMQCERECRAQNRCPWDTTADMEQQQSGTAGRSSSKCPGKAAWCPHMSVCLVCERGGVAMSEAPLSSSGSDLGDACDGCMQCMFMRGNGEAAWSVCHSLLSTSSAGSLRYIFLDFDGTLTTTKRGESPITTLPATNSAECVESGNDTTPSCGENIKKAGGRRDGGKRHEADGFLRELCNLSDVEVHIITRNSHVDAIGMFIIKEGCCTSDRPLSVHQVGGKTEIKNKWDVIYDILRTGESGRDIAGDGEIIGQQPLAIFVDDTLEELMPSRLDMQRRVKEDGLLSRVCKFHFSNMY